MRVRIKNKSKDKNMFKRTAQLIHKRNKISRNSRGGIRL